MENKKVEIFKRGSFELGVSTILEDRVLEMLRNMTVGSTGAQYLHKDIDERMNQLQNKYFMYLNQSDHIKATVTTALRVIEEDFGKANAYYIRYFMFNEKLQASKEKRGRHGKPGLIKGLLQKYFSDSPAVHGLSFDEDIKLPSFYYAFFDAENYRSTELSQILGLSPVGEFDTFTFTRLHPQRSSKVERLEKVHYESMRSKLRAQYKSFSVYTDQFLFMKENYFVWRENGEIVAGVQANPCEWELKHMSGLTGVFMLHILPHTPGLKQYINPKKFKFITLDYIYVKPGHEEKLQRLFTTVLNEFNVTFSLFWQDVKSPLHSLMKSMDMGLLSNFSKVPTGKIMMTLSGVSEEQKEAIIQKPVFTCGFDMS
ncbi:hypothetical protein KFE94_10380 [bacterium SCSIO 12643]|nr:hypothetical protein KFE94_10380 [bacterium SCSIO 12643]